MSKEKEKKLPRWVNKLATELRIATITIDSMTAIKTNLGGGLFSFDLEYLSNPGNFWYLDLLGKNIEAVHVNFTVKNNTGRVLTGVLGGFVDNIALTQVSVENLANGESVSGFVSFDRLLGELGRVGEFGDPGYGMPGTITANPLTDGRYIATGPHALVLTFRESVPSPYGPMSSVVAMTTAVVWSETA